MARIKHQDNGHTRWTLEAQNDAPLSEKVTELRHIFNYYKNRNGKIGESFIMQLLSLQAEYLETSARQQETDMKALKKELASLKKELAEIKNPPVASLDKATFPRRKPE